MFVKHKRFEKILKFNFIYDKELPSMGSISERYVLPISDRLCNPKEVAPHTKTFSMRKKNEFVVKDRNVQATPAQNLEQLNNILKLEGCSRIIINYRLNKVTACCSCLNKRFGAKAENVREALRILQLKVTHYEKTKEFLIMNPA